MLYQQIKQITSEFVSEAKSSPSLIEDMAAMESYMAESYSGRTIIELLQNADDALSTKTRLMRDGDTVYFANNGKPFDEADVLAICRSGASSKERGSTIGYRGVGFKSSAHISNEILIFSAGICFSFSKKRCALALGMAEDSVPTIRIPLLVEPVPVEIGKVVNSLYGQGFTTVFVFTSANIGALTIELEEVKSGTFLFLKSLELCEIEGFDSSGYFAIERSEQYGNLHVSITDGLGVSQWVVVRSQGASVAFFLERGLIAPCPEKEALFHCFLPSLEPVCYPIKVNADFSTDPSRKHITYDERSGKAIAEAANLLYKTVRRSLNEDADPAFKRILSILSHPTSFTRANVELIRLFKGLLENNSWIKLQNGEYVKPKDYKMLPSDLEIFDVDFLRVESATISRQSLPKKSYQQIDCIDSFLEQFSESSFSNEEMITVASDQDLAERMNPQTRIKVVAGVVKREKRNAYKGDGVDLSTIVFPTDDGQIMSVRDIEKSKAKIDSASVEALSDALVSSELNWFKERAGITDVALPTRRPNSMHDHSASPSKQFKSVSMKPHVSKWRDAKHKCCDIERLLGNEPEDVSLRNEGYDVISTAPNGEVRYIEIKSVKKDWSFSITNNEYTAAAQLGDQYLICLLCENESNLQVRYIRNPLNSATFEKRVRQWEWVCTGFASDEMLFDVS